METRHSPNERTLEAPLDGPIISIWSNSFCHPISQTDKPRPHQFWDESIAGDLHFVRLACRRWLYWRLATHGQERWKEKRRLRSRRPKIQVDRLGLTTVQDSTVFLCANGSLKQEDHVQHHAYPRGRRRTSRLQTRLKGELQTWRRKRGEERWLKHFWK